eukprot:13374358-Alexandrium_andersonii.AAC.1
MLDSELANGLLVFAKGEEGDVGDDGEDLTLGLERLLEEEGVGGKSEEHEEEDDVVMVTADAYMDEPMVEAKME